SRPGRPLHHHGEDGAGRGSAGRTAARGFGPGAPGRGPGAADGAVRGLTARQQLPDPDGASGCGVGGCGWGSAAGRESMRCFTETSHCFTVLAKLICIPNPHGSHNLPGNMDYCSVCRRHINGALSCPGCGTPVTPVTPVEGRLTGAGFFGLSDSA